jgi:hypothetical protein
MQADQQHQNETMRAQCLKHSSRCSLSATDVHVSHLSAQTGFDILPVTGVVYKLSDDSLAAVRAVIAGAR